MSRERISEEVVVDNAKVVRVTQADVGELKSEAVQTPRRRIRLCAHRSSSDTLHEMLIIHERGTYVRPHKHLGKIESFHIIEGEADIIIYEDNGEIADLVSMGAYTSGKPFYYRLTYPAFHTLNITSDVLVFHEITNGPFRREDTVFAEWAPEENDSQAVKLFMDDMHEQIVRYSKERLRS